MAYAVTIDFGAGAVDVSAYLHEDKPGIQYPVRRSRRVHKDLKPVVGTCSFYLAKRDNSAVNWSTLLGYFMAAATDPVVVVTSGGSGYFKGTVRRTVKAKIGQMAVEALQVQCVDPLYRLRKKATTSAAWSSSTVSNPSSKSTSILHQLFYAAGFSDGELSFGAIAMTVDRYVIDGTAGKTYRELIEEILRDVVYSVWVDDGVVYTYDLAPASISTTGTLSTGSTGNIVEGYTCDRSEEKAEAVDVTYYTHETLTGETVFEDTTGATAALDCSIPVAAGAFYPEGSDASTSVLAQYEIANKKIIAVDSAVISWNHTGDVTKDVETAQPMGMLMRFSSATGGVIISLKVTGNALVIKDKYIDTKENVASTELRESIESRLIILKAWAERLAGGRAAWHLNSDYEYDFPRVSAGSWTVGQLVALSDTTLLGVTQNLRIVEIDDGGDPLTVRLICEGVGAYTYAELDETVYRQSFPVPPAEAAVLESGTLVLDPSGKRSLAALWAKIYSDATAPGGLA
jgi:hypothetical protein